MEMGLMRDFEKTAGEQGNIVQLVNKALPLIAENSRALFVVAVLLTIVFGAALADPDLSDQLRTWLTGVAGLMLFGIIVLLYLLARITSQSEVQGEGLGAVRRAVETINGNWWQLIYSDDTPGLSLITIDLSPLPGRHRLWGEKWKPNGDPLAQWSSRAVAIQNIQPLKLFYIWDGSVIGDATNLSGVGTLRFPGQFGAELKKGNGWFTTGSVEQLDFHQHSSVVLYRASKEDMATMAGDNNKAQKELIVKRYASLAARV